MQSVVLKISVQPHTLLHMHVVVKRPLQKQTLLIMLIKIILIPNDPVRYDNWIAVYAFVVDAANTQASSTIMFRLL